MSYSKKTLNGKTVKSWDSIEENHPETMIAENAAERSADSAEDAAASAQVAATEATEAKQAALQAAASASKSATSMFERAEALKPNGLALVDVIPYTQLLERYLERGHYSHPSTTSDYNLNEGFGARFKIPVQKNGINPKSIILECVTQEDNPFNWSYDTLCKDRAILLYAENKNFKRLFGPLITKSETYLGTDMPYTENEFGFKDYLGLTKELREANDLLYIFSPLFMIRTDKDDAEIRDPFTGLLNLITREVYLEEDNGVMYLYIEVEALSRGCDISHHKKNYIKIHYNPADFEAEEEQEANNADVPPMNSIQ